MKNGMENARVMKCVCTPSHIRCRRQQLNINIDPNWQVKTFTDTLLTIMSSFIPNEIKRFVPRDPPWISQPLKAMLI